MGLVQGLPEIDGINHTNTLRQLCLWICLAGQTCLLAQPPLKVSMGAHENQIAFSAKHLARFFGKLRALELGQLNKVRVVHIGDSHIQADVLTGEVRHLLQDRFGDAGRGLLFPYQVAGTNAPADLRSNSPNTWKVKRNVFPDIPLPVGVSGITLRTFQPDFLLTLGLNKTFYGTISPFDKVTVFSGYGTHHSLVRVKGQAYMSRMLLGTTDEPVSTLMVEAYLPNLTTTLTLEGYKGAPNQTQFTFYGLSVEKSQERGVLYHSIGVNGAQFKHYNQSRYFIHQLKALKPDLVILSLGTNEITSGGFGPASFGREVLSLVTSIRNQIPGADILLTTPPDVLRRRSEPIKEAKIAGETLMQVAKEQGLACWDLLEVMGGTGAMKSWYAQGLASEDRVHFSYKGYRLQGELFFQALMDAYALYLGEH